MMVRGLAQRLGIRPFDVGLAVGLLVLGYWNLWVEWENYYPGTDPHLAIDTVTVAVATLALLARRRAPVAVLIVVNAAQLGPDLFVATGPVFWGEWIPSLVAAYSVAAFRGGPVSALPLAAGLASFAVFSWRYPEEFWHLAAAMVWLGPVVIAVAAGLGIARLRTTSSDNQRRAEQLEQSQIERAERAVAQERARIARELHDVIAHRVSIMVVQASAAENTLGADPAAAQGALRNVQTAGREALEEMRLMLGVLRDDADTPSRAPVPSLQRLDGLVEPLRAAGMDLTVHAIGIDQPLPPALDVSAYRVVQEALTNSLKHAVGATVVLTVDVGADGVHVQVRDRGGTKVNGDGAGLGLLGLRERVALHGGSIHAAPGPDGGFELRAHLPLTAAVPS
jgi:signal transduction histidine kinase